LQQADRNNQAVASPHIVNDPFQSFQRTPFDPHSVSYLQKRMWRNTKSGAIDALNGGNLVIVNRYRFAGDSSDADHAWSF